MSTIETITKRRSVYSLNSNTTIGDEALIDAIKTALQYTPSAYHAQSQKIMVLLHEQHDRFWQLVMESLRKIVPANSFERTEKKINGFQKGFGTILFFNDESITNGLIEKFPLYKDNFIHWAREQNGMLQINLWNLLAEHNLGASLQHYTEVIDAAFRKEFEVPKHWTMLAQMPFGGIEEYPAPKEYVDLKNRMIVLQ